MPATATYTADELVTRSTPQQHILAVTFRSADGRRRRAVGGGETVAAAIEWARACCPDDTIWHVDDWNDLYAE